MSSTVKQSKEMTEHLLLALRFPLTFALGIGKKNFQYVINLTYCHAMLRMTVLPDTQVTFSIQQQFVYLLSSTENVHTVIFSSNQRCI